MTETDVTIVEEGPRDGLQSVEQTMPTAAKLRWIDALAAAGLRHIQVGSFVSARALPQMADSGGTELADALVSHEADVKSLISGIDGFKAYYFPARLTALSRSASTRTRTAQMNRTAPRRIGSARTCRTLASRRRKSRPAKSSSPHRTANVPLPRSAGQRHGSQTHGPPASVGPAPVHHLFPGFPCSG